MARVHWCGRKLSILKLLDEFTSGSTHSVITDITANKLGLLSLKGGHNFVMWGGGGPPEELVFRLTEHPLNFAYKDNPRHTVHVS